VSFSRNDAIDCLHLSRGYALPGECFGRFDNAKDPYNKGNTGMNFEDIDSNGDLEIVSEESQWQNFERLTAFIFEKNDFEVKVNTVKTWNKKRRQYDVIARKSNQTFLVECKKWAGNRYRLSALKRAVGQHKERSTFYESIMNEDAIPLLVTLIEEEIRVFEGVPLVPVGKLDSFIGELDSYVNGHSFCTYEDDVPLPDDTLTESYDFSGQVNERNEGYLQ